MSVMEFEDFLEGKVLINDTKHRTNGKNTDSEGFCFFPEDPDEAYNWLSGIVTDEVCATFEVPENKVRKSTGTYIDPDASDNSLEAMRADVLSFIRGERMKNTQYIERTEYCCNTYSEKDFKLLHFKYIH